MSDELIKVEELTKSYNDKRNAVDKVSFTVEKGEVFALLGVNGAGKTTIIKSILGMLKYDAGNIYFKHKPIKDSFFDFKKSIAYIPDESNIYPYLTGLQYINLICTMYGIDLNSRKDRLYELASMFKMDMYLNKMINTYSKGTKQKLLIISEFIHEPELIIMDEPFTALDPEMILVFCDLINDYVKSSGTVIIASHIIDLVERICTKYAIINNGKVMHIDKVTNLNKGSKLEEVFFNYVKRT